MRKLEDQAMLRFVIGGGQMLVVEGGAQHILPQGERLRNLGLQATSRHLLRQWGLYKTLALKAGSTSLEPAAQEERATTIIAGIQHAASDVLSERDLLSTYRAGKTVLSLSRDICHVGSFVLIDGKLQDGRGSAERTGTLTAARIRSICVPNNGLASTFLIVLLLDDTGWNEDLAARTMKESKALAVVKAKRVVQLINVQHNCVTGSPSTKALSNPWLLVSSPNSRLLSLLKFADVVIEEEDDDDEVDNDGGSAEADFMAAGPSTFGIGAGGTCN
ncbi:unnamed protein product [Tilletia controversa]|nr:unnamed protein product [Tilletia controversa]